MLEVGLVSAFSCVYWWLAGMSSFVKFLFESVAHFFIGSSQSHLDVFVPLPFGNSLSRPKRRGRVPNSVTQLMASSLPT